MTAHKSPTSKPAVPPATLLLKVEEAALLLNVSRTTVYMMMSTGELASVRCGAARRIPRSVIDEWITRQLRQSDQ